MKLSGSTPTVDIACSGDWLFFWQGHLLALLQFMSKSSQYPYDLWLRIPRYWSSHQRGSTKVVGQQLSHRCGTRQSCTTAAVDLPYNAPELISCLEMQTSALMPIRFAMMERFGDFWQSNFSDSVDWWAIFPLPSLNNNIPGGPGQAPNFQYRFQMEAKTGIKDDVAGIDEAKEELQRSRHVPQTTGTLHRDRSRIPKGVLLIGPPGTGKLYLAKAIAGEAGVPFCISVPNSWKWMSASRVRDLFKKSKDNAHLLDLH